MWRETGVQRVVFRRLVFTAKHRKLPPNGKKSLGNSQNKEALVEFLYASWKESDFHVTGISLKMYYAHGSKCHVFQIHNKSCSVSESTELNCDHEEADTRLLLHSKHASQLKWRATPQRTMLSH